MAAALLTWDLHPVGLQVERAHPARPRRGLLVLRHHRPVARLLCREAGPYPLYPVPTRHGAQARNPGPQQPGRPMGDVAWTACTTSACTPGDSRSLGAYPKTASRGVPPPRRAIRHIAALEGQTAHPRRRVPFGFAHDADPRALFGAEGVIEVLQGRSPQWAGRLLTPFHVLGLQRREIPGRLQKLPRPSHPQRHAR